MKNRFYKSKNMSSNQKEHYFIEFLTNKTMIPLMTNNDIEHLKARKKAINDFNTVGDNTITIINDILDSALAYLYYKKFYIQNLEK